MVRTGLMIAAAAGAGLLVINLLFAFVLPVLWLGVKIALGVAVFYLVLRLVNPEFASKMKEKCCGAASFTRSR